MSKLNNEELSEWIDFWCGCCRKTCIEMNCIEGIEKCRQAYQQIKEMIQKPEVHQTTRLTIIPNEWLQEKTKELIDIISKGEIEKAVNFIRSCVEEIKS